MRSPVTVTAVVLLALAGAALPARAAGAPGEPKPSKGLFLTVSGSSSTWMRGVLLRCAPDPSGPHPDAAGACAALGRANGDFDKLPGNPRACTKQYEPVTVSAAGTWGGVPTAWRKTYPNACVLDTATGPVFRF